MVRIILRSIFCVQSTLTDICDWVEVQRTFFKLYEKYICVFLATGLEKNGSAGQDLFLWKNGSVSQFVCLMFRGKKWVCWSGCFLWKKE